MGSNVPIDSETSMVTSSISRSNSPAQFFRGCHRNRVCVCAFIGVSVLNVCVCIVFIKKMNNFFFLFCKIYGSLLPTEMPHLLMIWALLSYNYYMESGSDESIYAKVTRNREVQELTQPKLLPASKLSSPI
jgi:hypothetical protein